MRQENVSLSLPRPGKALIGVMVTITCLWVMMATATNWADVPVSLFEPFLGDTRAVLRGQIWRIFTAPLIHVWTGSPSHLVTTLLGLYFLGTSLESRWGAKSMLLFLGGASLFAYAVQIIASAFVPKLGLVWFGGLGMIEAVAVAWALSARGQTVRLFFLIPITPMALLAFIFVMSVLNVFAGGPTPEGLATPFGGMLAGYLFGDLSPLRRFYLKLRLRRLEAQSEALRRPATRSRAGAPQLRVIPGGQKDRPKDKRYLN